MSFNLRFAFGVAFGIFIFCLMNIILFGFGISSGQDKPLISAPFFPIIYFIFILLFLLVILLCVRSKLSSRSSMVIMLFLVMLLSVSAAYSTNSIKEYYSTSYSLSEQKQLMADELSAIEAKVAEYQRYSDSIVNLSDQYTQNNAKLKVQLNQLAKKKADADAALKQRELEIEIERLRLELEQRMLQEALQAAAYEEQLYYDDDDYYEDDD